jgi:hypothetical protein
VGRVWNNDRIERYKKGVKRMTREEAIFALEYHKLHFATEKGAEAFDMAIKALEQEPKWIPASERLPEKRGDYLVTQKATFTDYVYISVAGYALNLYDVDEYDFADKKRSGWYEYDSEWGYRELDDVIAWMPLIEPYKAESEDTE